MVLSTFGSAMADTGLVNTGSASPVPIEIPKLPSCSPGTQTDLNMPPVTIGVDDAIDVSVYVSDLSKTDLQAVMAGKKMIAFRGVLSYQDNFQETLKTVWLDLHSERTNL